MNATTPTSEETAESWRQATFEELGFSAEQAKVLAQAKTFSDVKTKLGKKLCESPLHYVQVRRLLEKGWTKEQILQVYS